MLIRSLDPERVDVHVATNSNSSDLDKTLAVLHGVPTAHVMPLDLGNETAGQSSGKLGTVVRNLGAVVSLLRLVFYIVRHRIDVLHSTDRPRDALFATLLAKLTRRRNIVHVHIKWYPDMGRATGYGLANCSAVLAISRFVRRSLIEGGIAPERIYTAYNATDASEFDPAKVRPGFLRERFGLPQDTPLIGIVARIMVWKGHLELIEALAAVKKAIPDVQLAIVGKEDTLAFKSDEIYADQVRRRIAELRLEENVIWAGWFDEMPSVMADLDVLAVPSWEEPFGLVVTEGMAMRRPIVAFASGALPEIVTDGEEGLLVPQKATGAFANALIDLLRDPPRRSEMGRRGRERVIRDFNPKRQADEVIEIYRRVIGMAPSPVKQVEAE